MIRRILCAVGLALALAAPAEARSNITVDTTLVAGGVSYVQFTVTTAGAFDIWTTSRQGLLGVTPFDSTMFLFAGPRTIPIAGAQVAADDDSCFVLAIESTQCGHAAVGANSILNNLVLALGTYTVAVGAWPLIQDEARTGVNVASTPSGDFSIRIASTPEFIGTVPAGEAAVDAAAVPEPASLALLGTGLAAVIRRRRRTARH